MKNKNKLKLLLSLMLLATPSVAQTLNPETQKRTARARHFAEFLLYWSNWNAYIDVKQIDRWRAERDTYEEAKDRLYGLVRDSTYYADEIVKASQIINKRFSLDEKPDMAFFMYELRDIYKDKSSDKNSDEYKLGKNLDKYERVLKKLKLTRYTISLNKQKK